IKEKEKESKIYSRVITRLNELASTKYKASTKKTQTLINARVKEGFNEDDFYKVIDVKAKEWLGTEMEKYLRPETLFGTKFENYLNQKEKTPTAIGGSKKNSYNHNICKDRNKNVQKIKIV
ncbi:conserved phage C-terminal domain-containing protein, partial [Romboutsia sp.]|uniref:conserved phage C-terminal domain-containing protein n=1 Tax=Romboutsia sp. TaxID=1965302 RepID=UPI002CBA8BFC